MGNDAGEVRLPLQIEEVDAAWLTSVLATRYPGVQATAVRVGRVLPGSATKVWLHVSYNEAGARAQLPATMVLKTGFDPKMRALAAAVYEREALFFGAVAPRLGIPLPACYFAGTDRQSNQSALLLEDLVARGCTFGHIAQPLTPDVMAQTLELLAALHAKFWNRPDAPELRGFASSEGRFFIVDFLLGPENWDRCLNAPRARDIPASIRNRDAVAGAVVGLRRYDAQGPHCLIHGDAHIGNMYFEGNGAPRFLDWQAAMIGAWIQDVAYAITCQLETPARRAHEQRLLRHYLDALRARGVADAPAFDAAWLAYRRQVAYGILGLLCTPEMQTDEYARIMGTRFALAMDDLGTLQLFA